MVTSFRYEHAFDKSRTHNMYAINKRCMALSDLPLDINTSDIEGDAQVLAKNNAKMNGAEQWSSTSYNDGTLYKELVYPSNCSKSKSNCNL